MRDTVVVTDILDGTSTTYVGVDKVLVSGVNFVVCLEDGRCFTFIKQFYSYRYDTVISKTI